MSESDPPPVRSRTGHDGRRRESLISRTIKIVFGVLVCAFGVGYVITRWSGIEHALARSDPGWIVAAVAFAAIGQWAAVLGFRAVLSAAHQSVSVVDVSRVYFVSQLGKYLPGSIWPLVAVTQMCQRHGIARRTAAVAGVITMIFSLVTSAVVGAVFLLIGADSGVAGLWWLALLAPAAFLVVYPKSVERGVGIVLRLLRREPIDLDLSGTNLLGALGWPMLSWLLLGLQCWALVVALGGPVLASLAGSVGGFALAYAAGTLFLPAPAGAGIREAVLSLALISVVSSSAVFGHEQVILVALLSRVLLAALDFVQAAAALRFAGHAGELGPAAP